MIFIDYFVVKQFFLPESTMSGLDDLLS